MIDMKQKLALFLAFVMIASVWVVQTVGIEKSEGSVIVPGASSEGGSITIESYRSKLDFINGSGAVLLNEPLSTPPPPTSPPIISVTIGVWYCLNYEGAIGTNMMFYLTPGQMAGSRVPANVPREGYTFLGWNTARDGTGTVFTSETIVNINTYVFAQWQAVNTPPTPIPTPSPPPIISVTIGVWYCLNHEGAIVTNMMFYLTPGQTAGSRVPTNVPRGGYTFVGWNTERDGTGTVFTSETIVNINTYVFAQWQAAELSTILPAPTTPLPGAATQTPTPATPSPEPTLQPTLPPVVVSDPTQTPVPATAPPVIDTGVPGNGTPSVNGGNNVTEDEGIWLEVDDDGTPIGAGIWYDDNEAGTIEEYAPLANLPQAPPPLMPLTEKQVNGSLAWWLSLSIAVSCMAMMMGFFEKIKVKRANR